MFTVWRLNDDFFEPIAQCNAKSWYSNGVMSSSEPRLSITNIEGVR